MFLKHIKSASYKAATNTTMPGRVMVNIKGPKLLKRKLMMSVTNSIMLYRARTERALSDMKCNSFCAKDRLLDLCATTHCAGGQHSSRYRNHPNWSSGFEKEKVLWEEDQRRYEESQKTTMVKWQKRWLGDNGKLWTASYGPRTISPPWKIYIIYVLNFI